MIRNWIWKILKLFLNSYCPQKANLMNLNIKFGIGLLLWDKENFSYRKIGRFLLYKSHFLFYIVTRMPLQMSLIGASEPVWGIGEENAIPAISEICKNSLDNYMQNWTKNFNWRCHSNHPQHGRCLSTSNGDGHYLQPRKCHLI